MAMIELQKWVGLVLLAASAGPASAQIFAPDLATQQFQAQSIIQQQNLGTQLNNLQLQQNVLRDQIREQQLFAPQSPYGAAAVFQPPGAFVPGAGFQPQPSGLMPNLSRPATPPPEVSAAPAPAAKPQAK